MRLALGICLVFLLASCGKGSTSQSVDESEPQVLFTADTDGITAPEKLSDFGLFQEPISELKPGKQLLPYALKMPLFSDYAEKSRFVHIPDGAQAHFDASGKVIFPVGTTIFKTFWYPDNDEMNLIETRVLFLDKSGWQAWPYVWNEAQTDAFYTPLGENQMVTSRKMGTFEYSIPNQNQCKSCHLIDGKITTIGPSIAQLNSDFDFGGLRKNQWSEWLERAWIAALPDYDNIPYIPDWKNHEDGTLDQRARAYLDINCAHCHNPVGPAKTSGLNLSIHNNDAYSLGVRKPPVAAGKGSGGLRYDIEPGKPEKSILHYRMLSNDPGIMMPELGRVMQHKEGLKLIEDWITQMN
jgi:uncharacterized repeat protein (TIGR03806 family)